MSISGPVLNNAWQIDQALTYSAIFVPIMLISVVSNLRLAMLATSAVRVARLSLLSFVFQMGYDFVMSSLHMSFGMSISGISKQMFVISAVSFINSFIDMVIVCQCYERR